MSTPYTQEFFDVFDTVSVDSAREILPYVIELLKPQHVVDVGCGNGSWLGVLRQLGVADVLGIDGSYVDTSKLHIPADQFLAHDLSRPLSGNFERRFDLALSLEVGEHLPATAASVLVETLTRLAPCVLFSAAIPFQGGTDHINEQWPNYWARLFAERGYETIDVVRDRFWSNEKVAYYYAQNMLLYVHPDVLTERPELSAFRADPDNLRLARVHPIRWMEAYDPTQQSLKHVLAALPHSLRKALLRRIKGPFSV